MSNILDVLKKKNINHLVNDDGSIVIEGDLSLLGRTDITSLPEGLSCKSLYLDPQRFDNVTYRDNYGNSSRTIFAA